MALMGAERLVRALENINSLELVLTHSQYKIIKQLLVVSSLLFFCRLRGSHLVECLREDIMAREPWSFKHKYLFERFSVADCLYSTDLKGHFSCVNALCFSHLGHEYLASGMVRESGSGMGICLLLNGFFICMEICQSSVPVSIHYIN